MLSQSEPALLLTVTSQTKEKEEKVFVPPKNCSFSKFLVSDCILNVKILKLFLGLKFLFSEF